MKTNFTDNPMTSLPQNKWPLLVWLTVAALALGAQVSRAQSPTIVPEPDAGAENTAGPVGTEDRAPHERAIEQTGAGQSITPGQAKGMAKSAKATKPDQSVKTGGDTYNFYFEKNSRREITPAPSPQAGPTQSVANAPNEPAKEMKRPFVDLMIGAAYKPDFGSGFSLGGEFLPLDKFSFMVAFYSMSKRTTSTGRYWWDDSSYETHLFGTIGALSYNFIQKDSFRLGAAVGAELISRTTSNWLSTSDQVPIESGLQAFGALNAAFYMSSSLGIGVYATAPKSTIGINLLIEI